MKITNASVVQASRPSTAISKNLKPSPSSPASAIATLTAEGKPWYWEGHVQARIVHFLKISMVTVVSEANTATREQGKDIEAIDTDGSVLWVNVKGFPDKSPNTQARHWFAGALLDLSLYRNQNEAARLALGLPRGFKTYENLVKRTASTLKFLGCHIFWVSENGSVAREVAALGHHNGRTDA